MLHNIIIMMLLLILSQEVCPNPRLGKLNDAGWLGLSPRSGSDELAIVSCVATAKPCHVVQIIIDDVKCALFGNCMPTRLLCIDKGAKGLVKYSLSE